MDEQLDRRFEMWAGCAQAFNADEMVVEWPIVDRKTCGSIKGFPKREQWFCATPTSEQQMKLCNWLNANYKD